MLRVPVEIQLAVEQFLAHEAQLLDEHKLDEWLALLADDVRYFMPINESLQQPADPSAAVPQAGFALFDDDKNSLALRAGRMQSNVAPTEVPAALLQRLITNIQVAGTDASDQYRVRSSFLVYQERRGRHASTFIGRRDDLLRHAAGSFKIARREIHLAQTLLPATISLFF
jgi:3-phenylpropionate/cinnamic acid dioxygenase small subunit